MKKEIKYIIFGIVYFLVLLISYFLFLPVINFKSIGFYFYLLFIVIIPISTLIVYVFRNKLIKRKKDKEIHFCKNYLFYKKKDYFGDIEIEEFYGFFPILFRNSVFSILGVVLTVIVFCLVGSKPFRAKSYYQQLSVKEDTIENFNRIFDLNTDDVMLPIIDKDLSFKNAQAKLGDYGAQYQIDYENFTLISVARNGKNELLRIAPLEYSNLFVSLSRKSEGTAGYIEVNVVTEETNIVVYEDGLKYMPSAKFEKDLDRHIRLKYKSEIYYDKYFEIDDSGNPYWIIPTIKKEIGIFGGKTSKGVIIVDPITGDMNRYDLGSEPSWVDRGTNDVILEKQATNYLKYKNGFINATIGSKKEVFQVSDGYNYFIKDGTTYYVSCITSPNEADQTSIGFLTINLKTGESTRYQIPGITEMRAREIATMDERVKAQQLDATWPILINYEGVPTYFLVLKNEVQYQKIVLINVSNGSMVAMGSNLQQAKAEYDKLLATTGSIETEELELTAVVSKLRDLGDTIEFLVAEIDNKYFTVDVNLSIDARFLKTGDNVTIKYKEYTNYNLVTSVVIN